ncbi:hypothetical protein GCM10009129_02030 [Psychrobacter aestuarii]|uniref:C-type lysozyme inhibitor domain-containing protein n=2 Tax=Psychrobacter aestuarii TaxID=556327 RepID=A0ABP3F738_9GAMM
MTGLLASVLALSACQDKAEPDSSVDTGTSSEPTMSAEPAEPNETVVASNEGIDGVKDDTNAMVDGSVAQSSYLCTPALKVTATYKDDANEVVLETDKGTLSLMQTNDNTNPEVYEASTALDGAEGFTQWRVAHEDRATGVMRMAGADQSDVTTYECDKVGA